MDSRQSNFETSPIAPDTSIVCRAGGKYRFTVLTDGLLRYEWSSQGVFEDRASTFIIHRDLPTPQFRVVQRRDGGLDIITKRFQLTYSGGEFTPNSLTVQVLGNVSDWKSRWRFGVPAMENLGGTSRTLDNIDGRMPLENGILSRFGYAELDDSETMLFDGKGWVGGRLAENQVDGYLFAYGNDYKTAIKDFYRVSGASPLLPRWSLGNWWSKFYPYSDHEYLKLMDCFKHENVPLSVSVIDVDWHLIQDERVQATGSSGWTGYTWSDKLFPNPEKFLAELDKRRLRVTLNDHPADGVYSFEDSYEAMSKALQHDSSNKDPILFDITNPAFCRAFFDVLRRPIEKQGVSFWWMDWQQGKYSAVPGLDPLWVLNHFSFLDNSLDGKRPLHFSRYAGPGSHRYPVGFSGDTVVSWASLKFQPEYTNTASNIGYSWWSHDIGGHMDGSRDEELETRWVQYGVFSPIMRLHSSANLWSTKEPWTFSLEPKAVQTKFLQYRHRMLPYLYSMNLEATKGSPLCQPMYWDFPKRDEAYTVPNQYRFGSKLIVVPITDPQNTSTRKASTRGWLPPGKYVDIFNETVYDGDRHLWLHRSLDQYPVLAREGAIIPLDAQQVPEFGCPNLEKLEVLIIVGADGTFSLFEDDGAGVPHVKSRTTDITFSQGDGKVTVHPTDIIADLPETRDWTFRFLACEKPGKISLDVNGTAVQASSETMENGFVVTSKGVSVRSKLTLHIGNDPKLAKRSSRSQLKTSISNAQMDYGQKNDIWAALDDNFPRTMQAARLHALPLEKPILDVLLEVVLAEA